MPTFPAFAFEYIGRKFSGKLCRDHIDVRLKHRARWRDNILDLEWMGAFGEGLAVLAAAGSVDVHPMHDFNEDQRIRWDQDMKFVDQQLVEVNQFFMDVISGGFARPEVADHVAFTFFGYRGPWYTIGYRMGRLVEKRFGRAVLIECMSNPRKLLAKYNEAASLENTARRIDKLPLWSTEILKAVDVPVPPQ
jgi:hypothetical protein